MTDVAADPAPEATSSAAHPLQRIATLDLVRGVAVMGILAMNIVGFAMPSQAYSNPVAYGGSTSDIVTWFVSFVFVDGKMRGFFSFLFGASMLLVIERAEAGGQPPAAVHYRRLVWLLVFGLIHLFCIWWGDILTHYALVGMIAYLFRGKTPKALIRWSIGLLTVAFLLMASGAANFFVMEAAATAPGASAEAIRAWADASSGFARPDSAALAADLAIYRGGYAGIFWYGFGRAASTPFFQLIFFGPETLAYMLLGMAGFRSRFLTGQWGAAHYRRIALFAIGIAVPAYAICGWAIYASGFDTAVLFAATMAATIPFRPVMIVGYAALVILLGRDGGWLVARISAAGRAAFTNYLGTSLLMTTLFYGYGFGLYGRLDRPELYGVVLVMWALMLAWSKPWLDRFRYGPFEWLWRSLARWQFQPMRRTE